MKTQEKTLHDLTGYAALPKRQPRSRLLGKGDLAALDWLVGQRHVGDRSLDVAREFHGRGMLAGHRARKTPAESHRIGQAAARYAVWRHLQNRELYAQVLSGHTRRRRGQR